MQAENSVKFCFHHPVAEPPRYPLAESMRRCGRLCAPKGMVEPDGRSSDSCTPTRLCVIPFHIAEAVKCAGRLRVECSIQSHAVSDRTRPGSDSSSPRYASTASIFSSMLPYVLPSTHLRTSWNDPLGGIQLRTVWRLDDGCQSNTPYHLTPVTTRSIPHQRLHVRVMLQAIDCRRYSRRPHRVDPTPQQPAPPNVYHQEQVRPLVDHLHSLMHLHSTTAPHPADHPPQPHSHLIGKAKGRIRTHARSGKGATEAPFFHDSCAPTSAFS